MKKNIKIIKPHLTEQIFSYRGTELIKLVKYLVRTAKQNSIRMAIELGRHGISVAGPAFPARVRPP